MLLLNILIFQDLTYSREEASSNIRTMDRAAFEAAKAGPAPASRNKKVDLESDNFPGLGAPQKKLEFPLASSKKKNKNKKNQNNNNANSENRAPANSTPAPASLSSICDFLGGNDKEKEKKQEEKEHWETVETVAKKTKPPEAKSDIKPIVGRSKLASDSGEVFRPSKMRKNPLQEEVKDNKPSQKVDQSKDFPSLSGANKSLGANFVKAEDKIFKPKVAPSQWSQPAFQLSPKRAETETASSSKTNGASGPPPGFTQAQDFPSLGGGVKKSPPGFSSRNSSSSSSSRTSSSAPPGFGAKHVQSNHKYTSPPNFQVIACLLISFLSVIWWTY